MRAEAVDHSELRRIHARLEWHGGFASTQHIRGHAFVVDEPEKLGGGDAGPTPLEYTLGAYDGCLQIVIAMIANELGAKVRRLAIESVATVDRRGLFGTAPVSPHYQRVETTIEVAFDERPSADVVDVLKSRLSARCPMYNLIRDAGIEQILHWNVLDA